MIVLTVDPSFGNIDDSQKLVINEFIATSSTTTTTTQSTTIYVKPLPQGTQFSGECDSTQNLNSDDPPCAIFKQEVIPKGICDAIWDAFQTFEIERVTKINVTRTIFPDPVEDAAAAKTDDGSNSKSNDTTTPTTTTTTTRTVIEEKEVKTIHTYKLFNINCDKDIMIHPLQFLEATTTTTTTTKNTTEVTDVNLHQQVSNSSSSTPKSSETATSANDTAHISGGDAPTSNDKSIRSLKGTSEVTSEVTTASNGDNDFSAAYGPVNEYPPNTPYGMVERPVLVNFQLKNLNLYKETTTNQSTTSAAAEGNQPRPAAEILIEHLYHQQPAPSLIAQWTLARYLEKNIMIKVNETRLKPDATTGNIRNYFPAEVFRACQVTDVTLQKTAADRGSQLDGAVTVHMRVRDYIPPEKPTTTTTTTIAPVVQNEKRAASLDDLFSGRIDIPELSEEEKVDAQQGATVGAAVGTTAVGGAGAVAASGGGTAMTKVVMSLIERVALALQQKFGEKIIAEEAERRQTMFAEQQEKKRMQGGVVAGEDESSEDESSDAGVGQSTTVRTITVGTAAGDTTGSTGAVGADAAAGSSTAVVTNDSKAAPKATSALQKLKKGVAAATIQGKIKKAKKRKNMTLEELGINELAAASIKTAGMGASTGGLDVDEIRQRRGMNSPTTFIGRNPSLFGSFFIFILFQLFLCFFNYSLYHFLTTVTE